MKKLVKTTFATKIAVVVLVLASAGIFGAGSANATTYGTEITKYDGVGYSGSGLKSSTVGEDNETEPGMVQSQSWDMEGFFLNSQKQLTVVGGYDFYKGNEGLMAGDIFISTNKNTVSSITSLNTIQNITYGHGYGQNTHVQVKNEIFNYGYVLHVDWAAQGNNTFSLIKLNGDSLFLDTIYGDTYNKPSNPWRYVSGGTEVYTKSFNTHGKNGNNVEDTGFLGMGSDLNHYAATFDISAIDLSKGALFHSTMECGNDNLIGQSAPVPEPSTFALFGLGLLGAGLARRRSRK